MSTHFPDPADLLNFTLTINPDEGNQTLRTLKTPSYADLQTFFVILIPILWTLGMYKGGSFVFSFAINLNYPHEPPKVKCTQKVSRWGSLLIHFHFLQMVLALTATSLKLKLGGFFVPKSLCLSLFDLAVFVCGCIRSIILM